MNLLNLSKTLKLLKKYDIPEPKGKITRTVEECKKAYEKINFPVVLKIISPDIIHKTDVGGVITNIDSIEKAKRGFKKLKKMAKKEKADFEGVFVQKQLKGYKILIGGNVDPDFGPIVAVGWGGIYTEILEDTVFRICPINKKLALDMIKELKVYKLLKGYRGRKKANIDSIIEVLLKANKMMLNEQIKELDFNPVFVDEKGSSVVDPRIIIE